MKIQSNLGKWKLILTMLIFSLVSIMSCKMPGGEVQADVYGDFEYEVDESNSTVTITRYTGSSTTVSIPSEINGLTVYCIGEKAFYNCESITGINIPDSIGWIGENAFSHCSGLTSIYIPKNVVRIDDFPFAFCNNISKIQVDASNSVYDSRNNCNAIVHTRFNSITQGCKNTIIPEGIENIGIGAFSGYSCIKSIKLPDSITGIGTYAFSYCSGLTSINLPEGLTGIGYRAFYNCTGLTSITIPKSMTRIGYEPFSGCSSVTDITIPDSVTSIGTNAFCGCESVTSITIPDSVTEIKDSAFALCKKLTSITLPSSITSIGNSVFALCDQLTSIYADEGSYAANWAKEKGYTVKPIPEEKPSKEDDKPSDNPADKPSVTPAKKGTILTSKSKKCKVKVTSSNQKNPTVAYVKTTNKKATKISIPDTVKINNITYKVTSIANKAFMGNKKIKTATTGKYVTSIGKYAFKNCTGLRTVNKKSKSFKKIGAYAFSGCKRLTKITLKSTKLTKSSVGKNALKGTNKKLVIKVPKNKVTTYKNYFKKKGNTKVRVTK